ncbi:MAG: MliC family protein [Betaproteobacteria bacterium]|nr:MliC family protein [Betaproteobacteria bacterium]
MRASAFVSAFLLCGCVYGPEMAVLPENIAYRCAEGREMLVRRTPDGMQAVVTVDGAAVNLRKAESAAQEKYVDGAWTLYLEGETAMLESQGTVVRAYCRSTAPLPVTPRMHY